MNTIYTWGYGKQVWEMLNGVKFFVNNGFYMIAFALAVMLFMLAIRFLNTGKLDYVMFLVSLIVVSLFLRPSSQSFNIVDEATGYGSTISNIPMGLGFGLALESQVEKAMLEKVENSFSTPNSITLRNAGMGFSFIAPLEMMNARPKNQYLQETFNHWINNCFLYDIARGNTNLNTVVNSTDILADIAPTVRFETLIFSDTHPDGLEVDCNAAYTNIATSLPTEANNYLNVVLPQKINMTGSANFGAALNGTQSLLHQASANSAKWVEQEMMRNMLDTGFRETATITGGEVATTAWSAAVAKAATNQTWRMTGQQAKNNLPVVRAVGISLLIGVMSIVAFYAVASLSFKALFMVFAGFLTLGLWSPIAALINYQVYRRAEDALSVGFGTLANTDAGLEQISSYAANLEWWYGAIPMISYMLISGGGMSAMYLLRDAASGSGAGAGAGIGASKGNIDYGNQSVKNATYNEERANHQSYIDYQGDHSRVDSSGSQRYSMNGTDATGGGFNATSSSSAAGGGLLSTSNAAGSSDINYNASGDMVDGTWNNSSLSNKISDISSASVSQAKQSRDQANQSFSQDLSYSMGEAQSKGIDIKDAQSLSNHFGVDATTANSTVEAVKEAEGKSLKDTLTSSQIGAIEKETGKKITFGAGGNFKVLKAGADGYTIESQKNGERYTSNFESGQYEQYEKSKTSSLADTLSSRDGVLAQYANSVTDGTAHVDSKTKTDADKYSDAVSHLDAVTEQSERVHRQAKENGANLNGQILQEYIKQDPTLSKKWDKATNDNQRANVVSTGQTEIQKALLKPRENPHEYAKVQDAIKTVSNNYGHNEVKQDAEADYNSYTGGGSHEISSGNENIQGSKVPGVNGNAERGRLDTEAGEDMKNINNHQSPINAFSTYNGEWQDINKNKINPITHRQGGDAAWRNNNPGNLMAMFDGRINPVNGEATNSKRSHDEALKAMQDKYDGVQEIDRYGSLIFDSKEHGDAAQRQLISSWGNKSISDAIHAYAPPNDANDTQGYIKSVASDIGVSPQTKIGDLDASQKEDLFKGIKKVEGQKEGTYLDPSQNEHFDIAHRTMDDFVSINQDRLADGEISGVGKNYESRGAYGAGSHNPRQTWNRAEKEGIIEQIGGTGSRWKPGKNFDEKLPTLDTKELHELLQADANGDGVGWRMNKKLHSQITDALSRKGVEKGNAEDIKTKDLKDLKA